MDHLIVAHNCLNNGANWASISSIENEQYKEEMGDDDGEKDWVEVAVQSTNKVIGDFW